MMETTFVDIHEYIYIYIRCEFRGRINGHHKQNTTTKTHTYGQHNIHTNEPIKSPRVFFSNFRTIEEHQHYTNTQTHQPELMLTLLIGCARVRLRLSSAAAADRASSSSYHTFDIYIYIYILKKLSFPVVELSNFAQH